MKKIKIVIVLLFISLNVSYTFSQTKNINVENPIEYFHKRTEAISLAKSKNWQESITTPLPRDFIAWFLYINLDGTQFKRVPVAREH